MKDVIIRNVLENDIPQLVSLCSEHAAYEQVDYDPTGKAVALIKHLLGPESDIICWVVEENKELIGYTVIMKQFSTWDAYYYLYMGCLYLKERKRGMGLGSQLMKKIKDHAKGEGCFVQWQTPSFNEKAIAFYEQLGAHGTTKERFIWQV